MHVPGRLLNLLFTSLLLMVWLHDTNWFKIKLGSSPKSNKNTFLILNADSACQWVKQELKGHPLHSQKLGSTLNSQNMSLHELRGHMVSSQEHWTKVRKDYITELLGRWYYRHPERVRPQNTTSLLGNALAPGGYNSLGWDLTWWPH